MLSCRAVSESLALRRARRARGLRYAYAAAIVLCILWTATPADAAGGQSVKPAAIQQADLVSDTALRRFGYRSRLTLRSSGSLTEISGRSSSKG